ITSTPVALRTQALLQQGLTGRLCTPMTPNRVLGHNNHSRRPGLVRRTHTIIPSPTQANKENHEVRPDRNCVLGKRTLIEDSQIDRDSAEFDSDEADAMSDSDDTPPKKKGARAADLNPAQKRILDRALKHFRQQLAKGGAFPGEDLENRWAAEAWYIALGELVESHSYVGTTPPTEVELVLIKMRRNQLRGQAKLIARQVVREALGLKNTTDEDGINAIRTKIAAYRSKNAFIYTDPFDTAIRGTMYRSQIIERIICELWFGNDGQSEAIEYPTYFEDGIPLPAIALVCAVFRGALDEWKTGKFAKVTFSAKAYEGIFEHHLNELRCWHKYTSTRHQCTEKLQKDLLANGRYVLYPFFVHSMG
ncbi:hypothetical protein BD779DRAFT_1445754, partial [Infundibulicybe gibba]